MNHRVFCIITALFIAACSYDKAPDSLPPPPPTETAKPEPAAPPACSDCSGPDCDAAEAVVCGDGASMVACPSGAPKPASAAWCESEECTPYRYTTDAGAEGSFPCLYCCCWGEGC